MQTKKESEESIEKFRSKLALTGLTHGAFFGAIVLAAIGEVCLKQAPPGFNVRLVVELVIGGFIGALLGFFIGLGRGVYLYPP